MVVIFSWFGFTAIILISHICLKSRLNSAPLFKTKIEVAGNVPTRFYERNPGWMLLTYLWLFTISNQSVLIAGSIILSASREYALAGVLIVNGPTRSTKTMT
jgi:hypothetical protein